MPEQSGLALLGGMPVRTRPFLSWPIAQQRDLSALSSADLYQVNGPWTKRIAERFAAFNDVPYCVPVANGTVSLEMILKVLSIGYGDEVILPAYTFIATLSSIVYAGATPVFADIEPGSYNLDVAAAEARITDKTKAIVAVAIGGQPFDVEGFEALAKRHNIHLIVDAAQAVGAVVNGRSIGSYGTCASFSCQNTKNLTAGEGGFITTKDPALYETLLTLTGNEMCEAQAALLYSQMDPLPEQIITRSQNAAFLDQALSENPLFSPMEIGSYVNVHAYHLYRLRVDPELLKENGLTREDLIAAIHAEGLNIGSGYVPLYANPAIASAAVNKRIARPIDLTPLPATDRASYEEGLWFEQQLLLGSKEDMEDIAAIFKKVAANLSKLGDAKKAGISLRPECPAAPVEKATAPTTLEDILYSGVWGTYGPLEKETASRLAAKRGFRYAVLTHSFESAVQSVLRALELSHEGSVAAPSEDAYLLALAKKAATDMDQTILPMTEDFDTLKKECPAALLPGADAVEILSYGKIAAVVSDETVLGAIFTDDRAFYERLFAYHFCGHRPETGTADPNPDSGNIVGGDMRITEWQALAVCHTL